MPFLHIERYESIAHCGELLSATRGVLFVLKTPFFAKKIQKHEILPCKKLLFSLSVQNEEIPYKNSGFGNFFVRNSLFLEFLHQTNLKVSEIVVLKSTQKGLPAPDSDASYNCGFSKGKCLTTFQENLTVSAASTPGGAVLFCWVTASLKDFREVLLITLV